MPQPSASPGPVTSLRCTLDYPRLDDFVVRYGRNVSRAGVFLPMREPLEVGSTVRFEVMLAEGQVALRGEGTVSFRAPYEPGAGDRLHGIGLRFSRLDGHSREMIERVMAYKATHQAEFFEPARDPVLTPPSPFAFVSPTALSPAAPAPAVVAPAVVAATVVAPPNLAPLAAAQAPVVQTAAAPTLATVTTAGPTAVAPQAAPTPVAPPPAVSAASVVAEASASAVAVPKPAAASPAEAPAALKFPSPTASEPIAASKPAATGAAEASTAAKPTSDATAGTVGTIEAKPSPPAAGPALTSKESPASQKTPLRTVTIPRASLTARPSSQTPLVAMSLQNSAKTPVPTGDPDSSRQTPKLRASDSAQTPKVELPVPAAASEPRRPVSDSARTPRHSATTPVVNPEAAVKEAARSPGMTGQAPSSTSTGRGTGRSAPDERSRHDTDEELSALRTPASSRSAPSPDATKRLQELLGRRPGSGQKD